MTTPVGTLGTETDIVDLRQYAGVLWRRRGPAAAVAILILVATGLLSSLRPPSYQSESIIALRQEEDDAPPAARPAAAFLGSEAFLASAAEAITLAGGLAELQRMVRAEAMGETELIRLRVRHSDPRLASAVAVAVTDHFLVKWGQPNEPRRRFLSEQLTQVGTHLARVDQLAALSAEVLVQLRQDRRAAGGSDLAAVANAVRASAETEAVRERLLRTQRELRSELLSLTRAVVLEEPRVPSAATSRSYVLNLFFGGLLALVGGVAAAFALDAIQPLLGAQASEPRPPG